MNEPLSVIPLPQSTSPSTTTSNDLLLLHTLDSGCISTFQLLYGLGIFTKEQLNQVSSSLNNLLPIVYLITNGKYTMLEALLQLNIIDSAPQYYFYVPPSLSSPTTSSQQEQSNLPISLPSPLHDISLESIQQRLLDPILVAQTDSSTHIDTLIPAHFQYYILSTLSPPSQLFVYLNYKTVYQLACYAPIDLIQHTFNILYKFNYSIHQPIIGGLNQLQYAISKGYIVETKIILTFLLTIYSPQQISESCNINSINPNSFQKQLLYDLTLRSGSIQTCRLMLSCDLISKQDPTKQLPNFNMLLLSFSIEMIDSLINYYSQVYRGMSSQSTSTSQSIIVQECFQSIATCLKHFEALYPAVIVAAPSTIQTDETNPTSTDQTNSISTTDDDQSSTSYSKPFTKLIESMTTQNTNTQQTIDSIFPPNVQQLYQQLHNVLNHLLRTHINNLKRPFDIIFPHSSTILHIIANLPENSLDQLDQTQCAKVYQSIIQSSQFKLLPIQSQLSLIFQQCNSSSLNCLQVATNIKSLQLDFILQILKQYSSIDIPFKQQLIEMLDMIIQHHHHFVGISASESESIELRALGGIHGVTCREIIQLVLKQLQSQQEVTASLKKLFIKSLLTSNIQVFRHIITYNPTIGTTFNRIELTPVIVLPIVQNKMAQFSNEHVEIIKYVFGTCRSDTNIVTEVDEVINGHLFQLALTSNNATMMKLFCTAQLPWNNSPTVQSIIDYDNDILLRYLLEHYPLEWLKIGGIRFRPVLYAVICERTNILTFLLSDLKFVGVKWLYGLYSYVPTQFKQNVLSLIKKDENRRISGTNINNNKTDSDYPHNDLNINNDFIVGGFHLTPLNIACRRGDITAVKYLIKMGSNSIITFNDDLYCKTLIDATVGGNVEIFELILTSIRNKYNDDMKQLQKQEKFDLETLFQSNSIAASVIESRSLQLLQHLRDKYGQYLNSNLKSMDQGSLFKRSDFEPYPSSYQWFIALLSWFNLAIKISEDTFYTFLTFAIIAKNQMVFDFILQIASLMSFQPISKYGDNIFHAIAKDGRIYNVVTEVVKSAIFDTRDDVESIMHNGFLEQILNASIEIVPKPLQSRVTKHYKILKSNIEQDKVDVGFTHPVEWVVNKNIPNLDINLVNEKGFTPIHTAILFNNIDAIQYFIQIPNFNIHYKTTHIIRIYHPDYPDDERAHCDLNPGSGLLHFALNCKFLQPKVIIQLIQIFVSAGIDAQQKDDMGILPADILASRAADSQDKVGD